MASPRLRTQQLSRSVPKVHNSSCVRHGPCPSGRISLQPRVLETPCLMSSMMSSTCTGRRLAKTQFFGRQLAVQNVSTSKWRMATWLENKGTIECKVPLEACWSMWEDRTRIPEWMPWIKSVKVLPDDPRLSRWTLSTHQFGRDWEFSWLARNLTPIKNQKIHWVSEPGSTSMQGIEINNKGQIRFVRRPGGGCGVTLSIQYEVPDVLVPFANALTPLVTGIIQRDMERFKALAEQQAVLTNAKA